MSAIEDWNAFAATLGPAPGATNDSSGWSLVFAQRGRALALPNAARSEPAGLDFFLHTAGKWWWAQLAMRYNRLLRSVLPQVHLSAGQHEALCDIVSGSRENPKDASAEVLGIQFGSTGPLQKVMVLGCAKDGNWNVAKLALRPGADERIVAETAWLERLAGYPDLVAHVPAVSGSGSTALGRRYFVMRAMAGTPVAGAFSGSHAELLCRIAQVDRNVEAWRGSMLFRTIEERLMRLAAQDADGLRVLRSAWSAACRVLQDQYLPLCLNHGDFAAWNLLCVEHDLVALDWEYAQARWNPLGDFFHFHLIPAALDGSLRRGRVRRDRLLDSAARHAERVFAAHGELAASHAAVLLLVYLVDTVTFYALASGGLLREDPVVGSYLQCMAEQI